MQAHLSCVFIDSLMKTSVIIRAQMSQKLYEHLFANLALFEFPALSESRCWLIDSGTATTKTSETPRNLSLTGVWTQNMIMKALTALFCLFVLVSGLDNESCEDRGKYVPRHTNFTAEGKIRQMAADASSHAWWSLRFDQLSI